MPETKLGVYRHFKGGFYQVSAVALDTAFDLLCRDPDGGLMQLRDRRLVVYVALALKSGLRTRARTEDEFHEQVCIVHRRRFLLCVRHPPRDTCMIIPRYEYMGEEVEPWMLDIQTKDRARAVD